ncbi:hypothetical protein J6590_047214 [Homalodisca vitripennis]|nr:hypothetical protein J6590_047214 [Homalodisca vitripennis]
MLLLQLNIRLIFSFCASESIASQTDSKIRQNKQTNNGDHYPEQTPPDGKLIKIERRGREESGGCGLVQNRFFLSVKPGTDTVTTGQVSMLAWRSTVGGEERKSVRFTVEHVHRSPDILAAAFRFNSDIDNLVFST